MTETNTEIEGYRGPYLQRNGEDYRSIVEDLEAPPERPLPMAEKLEAYAFESGLYDHEIKSAVLDENGEVIEPAVTIADIIKDHKAEDIVAPQVFAEAFIQKAVDVSGLPKHSEQLNFTTHEQVYAWFATRANDKRVDEDTLVALAKSSFEYYKKIAAECLLARQDIPAVVTDHQSIVVDPVRAIELTNQAMHARQYLLEVRKKHTETEHGSDLDGAKRVYADIYLSKVNALIASDVPQMGYVIEQATLIGDSELVNTALSVTPLGFRNALQYEDREARLFTRLDYMRNGMGLAVDKENELHASAISEKLFEAQGSDSDERVVPQYTPEQIEVLKHATIAPDRVKQGISNILNKAGKLSQEDPSTWNRKRRSRAADGLVQVVTNPTKDSATVDSISGVYKCSPKPRPIYQVLTVDCSHELKHIDQMFADDEVGKTVRIAGIKGKRVGMLREAGANRVQRKFELWLSGKSKPIAMTYANALRAIGQGKGLAGAAKAFYNEKLRIMPEVASAKAADEAVDRVVRLVRSGGVASAALAYGEEAIMMHELKDASTEMQERATAITGLDLVDQQRLHRYGLLNIPSQEKIDWSALALEEFRPEIEAALATPAPDHEV